MTKVTRTYLTGCSWCNATGSIQAFPSGTIDCTRQCPVCNGSKVITISEEYEGLYQIDCSKIDPISIHSRLQEEAIPKSWKDLRKLTGLTLRQVAEKTGVSASTVSRIERVKGKYTYETYKRVHSFYYEKWKEQK